MNRALRVILLFAAALQFSHADEFIQLTAAANPYPPYIDPTHPHGGVAVQLANAAFNTQGYSVSNRIMPWARAIEETKRGRIDLVLDAWWNEERSKDFTYSRAYLNGPIKFIKRKGDPFRFDGFDSLDGKSIALIKNYAYDEEFSKQHNYERFFANDFVHGAKLLAHQRVDLALENELVARSRLNKEAPQILDQIEFDQTPLTDALVYAIVGKANAKHREIINAFNKGISIIVENGIFVQIMSENNLTMPDIFSEE